MAQFTGSCLCGKVRYSASADPIFQAVCHCKDCQRATGSAFEAIVAVPEGSVNVQGTLKGFSVKGGSGGKVTRSFCPECGSTMMTHADALPGMALLLTGPMDDTSSFKPGIQIFCASAQPGMQLADIQAVPGPPPHR